MTSQPRFSSGKPSKNTDSTKLSCLSHIRENVQFLKSMKMMSQEELAQKLGYNPESLRTLLYSPYKYSDPKKPKKIDEYRDIIRDHFLEVASDVFPKWLHRNYLDVNYLICFGATRAASFETYRDYAVTPMGGWVNPSQPPGHNAIALHSIGLYFFKAPTSDLSRSLQYLHRAMEAYEQALANSRNHDQSRLLWYYRLRATVTHIAVIFTQDKRQTDKIADLIIERGVLEDIHSLLKKNQEGTYSFNINQLSPVLIRNGIQYADLLWQFYQKNGMTPDIDARLLDFMNDAGQWLIDQFGNALTPELGIQVPGFKTALDMDDDIPVFRAKVLPLLKWHSPYAK